MKSVVIKKSLYTVSAIILILLGVVSGMLWFVYVTLCDPGLAYLFFLPLACIIFGIQLLIRSLNKQRIS